LDDQQREREVPVENLRAGMRLLIKPGAQFPVDLEIAAGETAADESNLTGESAPVAKGVGDTALAGTINLWGAVQALVLRPAAESSLQKIIALIREAQQQKAPAQRFTDRFSTGYTYGVLGLSLAMFFVWWLGFHLVPFHSPPGAHSAFYRAMTLLVVSSPCALVLSIPSAVLAAIAYGASHGILFRGGAAVEKLATVNVVALDKTGTLTTGELRVETVQSFPPGREDEVGQIAYSLEKLSTHPLARAVTRHGKKHGLASLPIEQFESVTGHGLRARNGKVEYRLGRREWVAPDATSSAQPAHPGFSEVWVSGDALLGRLILRDDIRAQARAVVDQLRVEKLTTIVLTGDRRATADYLRTELAVDDIRSELHPEQKVQVIRDLTAQGNRVAMVGESGRRPYRSCHGGAWFGCRPGAVRCRIDARPLGEFSGGVPAESAGSRGYSTESGYFPGDHCGARFTGDPGNDSAHGWRRRS
jgi:Cd2+/Zn2+-exporting ATPase